MQANSGDSDQTTHCVASDLGLHYLPMSHKKDAWHIWVKERNYFAYLLIRESKYIVEIIFLGISDSSKFMI